MDFNQLYKQWMESGREEPPEKVWEGIQDELDVNDVWARVNTELAARRGASAYYMLRAIAASFLLLLASATVLYYFVLQDYIRPAMQEVADFPDLPTPQPMPEVSPEQIPGTDQRETLQLAESDLVQTRRAEVQAEDTLAVRMTLAETFDVPGLLASKPGLVPDRPESIRTIRTFMAARHITHIPGTDISETDIAYSQTRAQRPAFFAGVNGQMGNTWMLNSKTISGLSANDITDTRPSFGGSYGFVAGVQLFPRMRIQAGVDLLAQNRQRYNEYIHGQYVSTEFQLDYTRLSVLFSFTPWEQRPWVLHGGGYSAYIRNAEQQINGRAEEISALYTNSDYGLTAGFGYLHKIDGPLELHTGIFTNYGLKNVFAGSDQAPASLNNTRLFSFQMSISLHYHIQP